MTKTQEEREREREREREKKDVLQLTRRRTPNLACKMNLESHSRSKVYNVPFSHRCSYKPS